MKLKVVDLAELAESEQAAVFRDHGAQVSFFVTNHAPGEGPGAYRHPYEETFLIYAGSVIVEVDAETVEAHAGQVVVVPAGAARSFRRARTARGR